MTTQKSKKPSIRFDLHYQTANNLDVKFPSGGAEWNAYLCRAEAEPNHFYYQGEDVIMEISKDNKKTWEPFQNTGLLAAGKATFTLRFTSPVKKLSSLVIVDGTKYKSFCIMFFNTKDESQSVSSPLFSVLSKMPLQYRRKTTSTRKNPKSKGKTKARKRKALSSSDEDDDDDDEDEEDFDFNAKDDEDYSVANTESIKPLHSCAISGNDSSDNSIVSDYEDMDGNSTDACQTPLPVKLETVAIKKESSVSVKKAIIKKETLLSFVKKELPLSTIKEEAPMKPEPLIVIEKENNNTKKRKRGGEVKELAEDNENFLIIKQLREENMQLKFDLESKGKTIVSLKDQLEQQNLEIQRLKCKSEIQFNFEVKPVFSPEKYSNFDLEDLTDEYLFDFNL